MIECNVSELLKAIDELRNEDPKEKKLTKEVIKVLCEKIESHRKKKREKKIDTILGSV